MREWEEFQKKARILNTFVPPGERGKMLRRKEVYDGGRRDCKRERF